MLIRRQLCASISVLIQVEGRALLPLLDALVSALNKACKETKATCADNIKCNTLACLDGLLQRFGVLCAGRLGEVYTLAKSCLKVGEDAAVRIAAVQVIVSVVARGGSAGHMHHDDALKLCKSLLHDKHSALVRMGAADLLTALAQHADKVHALGLEGMIQLIIKSLGDGNTANEPEGLQMSKVIGQVLASLATRSPAGPAVQVAI